MMDSYKRLSNEIQKCCRDQLIKSLNNNLDAIFVAKPDSSILVIEGMFICIARRQIFMRSLSHKRRLNSAGRLNEQLVLD
jgi:hypothetical protein